MPVTPRAIDVLQLGVQRAICCWQAGELLIDPGPASTLPNLLAALDGMVPRAVLLTHIHLDHAAATGALVRMYPELEVYVHERGARHLIDPSRLLASAARIYGDEMDRLWGTVEPVPAERVRTLAGGERLRFGDNGAFEVLYTPGHAVHHVSFLGEDGSAYVGDVAGTRAPGSTVVLPPTPPPDINPPDWQASIAALLSRAPARLHYTHFGVGDDVESHLRQLSDRLERWSAAAAEHDIDGWAALARADMESAGAGPGELEYQLGEGGREANYNGLRRYWDTRRSAG
jgi:glyoxylase-like metal-dependent hydrolase (beta-lactamase superfamily II)